VIFYGYSNIGNDIYQLTAELYPIWMSIAVQEFQQSMETLKRQIPLELHEVASGIQVFDWSFQRSGIFRMHGSRIQKVRSSLIFGNPICTF
jgi:aminopeptidase-like protein